MNTVNIQIQLLTDLRTYGLEELEVTYSNERNGITLQCSIRYADIFLCIKLRRVIVHVSYRYLITDDIQCSIDTYTTASTIMVEYDYVYYYFQYKLKNVRM